MSMTVDYTKAFAAWHSLQSRVNAGLSKRDWVLKESRCATYRALVKKYSQYARGNVFNAECVPMILTSNTELEKLSGRSARTVRRDRQVFRDLGIIVEEEFHGSHHEFGVRMAPEYLGLCEILEEETAFARLAALLDGEPDSAGADNLSALTQETNLNKINTEPSDVEKGVADEAATGFAFGDGTTEQQREHEGVADEAATGFAFGDGTTEQRTEQQRQGEPGKRREGRPSQGGDGARGGVTPGAKAPPPRLANVEVMVALLWTLSKQLLWKGRIFPDWQVDRSKAMIREIYMKVPSEEIDTWHHRFTQMVGCAHAYVSARPSERFIPPPWVWFSPDNAHGFRGTYGWALKREKYAWQRNAEIALDKAIQKWERNRCAPASTRRPDLDVYRECVSSVSKFNRPALLDYLNAFIAYGPEGAQIPKGYG